VLLALFIALVVAVHDHNLIAQRVHGDVVVLSLFGFQGDLSCNVGVVYFLMIRIAENGKLFDNPSSIESRGSWQSREAMIKKR
jgi:hypothetical protein